VSGAAILRVALIAHDAQKTDMLEWARWNRALLSRAKLCATKHRVRWSPPTPAWVSNCS